jgi:plastocyanin
MTAPASAAPRTPTREDDDRAWDVAIAGGIAAFAVGAILVQVVLAEAVIPPLVALPVLMLGALALRRSRRRWGTIAAGVLGLAAVLGNAPFMIDDLSHPADAPLQFAVSLLMLVAVIVIIAGAIGSLRSWAATRVRPVLGAGAAVVVLGAVAAGVFAAGADSDAAEDGDVTLQTKDIEFAPETITVASGGGVFVENDDLVRHTFTVEETDVDLSIPAGVSRRVDIDLEPGTYEFVCDVPGHEDMEGTLVVE